MRSGGDQELETPVTWADNGHCLLFHQPGGNDWLARTTLSAVGKENGLQLAPAVLGRCHLFRFWIRHFLLT